jgi:hypothetical protein
MGVGAIGNRRREFPLRRDPAVEGLKTSNEPGEPSRGFPSSPVLRPCQGNEKLQLPIEDLPGLRRNPT